MPTPDLQLTWLRRLADSAAEHCGPLFPLGLYTFSKVVGDPYHAGSLNRSFHPFQPRATPGLGRSKIEFESFVARMDQCAISSQRNRPVYRAGGTAGQDVYDPFGERWFSHDAFSRTTLFECGAVPIMDKAKGMSTTPVIRMTWRESVSTLC